MARCDEESLGRIIYYMAQDIRNLAEKVLAPYKLTVEQFQTLKILSIETGLAQRQLCQKTNKSPANMTRILDRFEVKSLIARRADPNDRRVYLVYLTGKGRSLLGDVMGVFELFSAQLHKGITTEMDQIARKVLGIMDANIEAISAEGVTRGCNPPINDRYCPGDPVTRGQMAAFLRRAFSLPATSQNFFTDDAGSVFEADIERLAGAGITRGCGPVSFCPDQPVPREQVAAFLHRALG